jgi:DNA uptake protein ComE-like DNA-binding protein
MPPVPMPPPPRVEPQGVAWSVVPLLTLGFGAPFSFVYAGNKARSWNLAAAGAGYGVAYLADFSALLASSSGSANVLGSLLLLVLWVTTSIHAFVARPAIYPRRTPSDRLNRHAVEMAKYRRMLRDEARRLLAEDPALAHELRIGRPDLPRTYDDGGLIDVNHVPAPTLGLLPGLTDEYVQKVIRVREETGTFVSVEELAVNADLPPDLLHRMAEYTIFLP